MRTNKGHFFVRLVTFTVIVLTLCSSAYSIPRNDAEYIVGILNDSKVSKEIGDSNITYIRNNRNMGDQKGTKLKQGFQIEYRQYTDKGAEICNLEASFKVVCPPCPPTNRDNCRCGSYVNFDPRTVFCE